MGVRKGQLEGHLLVLVTLGLVAFGLVMVFSATSAAATIGNGDPVTYLERQAVYAVFGVLLLIGASRLDYRALPALAPPLLLVSLALCALVLVVGDPVNGARRWLTLGSASRSRSGPRPTSRADRRRSGWRSSPDRSASSRGCSAR
jgi:cell division protein FtsW (lipid II flippase)